MHHPAARRLRSLLPFCCTFALLAPAAWADEYDSLREKWLTRLTGGSAANTADPDIAAQLATIASNAQANWSGMNTAAGRTYLWSDLASTTNSSHVTGSYTRLNAMALAYSTSGSSLYGNAALAADIVAGLDWLYANRYNPRSPITTTGGTGISARRSRWSTP
ncbi:hypothetical protein H9L41_11640 [Chitinimonas koreensis]|nr:hypothetical protein H9L41_11640 [Chitinimonas koreensis]